MRFSALLVCALFLTFCFSNHTFSQDDETRSASGLPLAIGGIALSGKVTLQGLDPSQKKPSVFVAVYYNGILFDKRQTIENGNYYIPNIPRQNGIIAVEINGQEYGRQTLLAPVLGSTRQDLTVVLSDYSKGKLQTGVVSAQTYYQRNADNQKIYEKALASREKDAESSIKLFKDIVSNDPKDFVTWTDLGTLYFKKEKFADAEEAYNKAIEQKPDFIVAQVNLGKLYLAQKQPEKAEAILLKAVATTPNSADAQYYLGETYLQLKKGSKAVVYLNEALKLEPVAKADAHLRLAALYSGANLKDKAVEEYKLFLGKVPDYKEKSKIEKYIKDNSPK